VVASEGLLVYASYRSQKAAIKRSTSHRGPLGARSQPVSGIIVSGGRRSNVCEMDGGRRRRLRPPGGGLLNQASCLTGTPKCPTPGTLADGSRPTPRGPWCPRWHARMLPRQWNAAASVSRSTEPIGMYVLRPSVRITEFRGLPKGGGAHTPGHPTVIRVFAMKRGARP